jgi:hypothetical protein
MTPDGRKLALPVETKLRISRLSRMVGWGRFKIVLDGGEVGTLARGRSVEMEVAPGVHTLQLFYRFGLSSYGPTTGVVKLVDHNVEVDVAVGHGTEKWLSGTVGDFDSRASGNLIVTYPRSQVQAVGAALRSLQA